ncbi:MAG TPA: hypothetical protein VFM02_04015 [Candidatus Paceibacterota bacterium]|nr:hypothetical protein [Candidatus Paceibacterota bacterium]
MMTFGKVVPNQAVAGNFLGWHAKKAAFFAAFFSFSFFFLFFFSPFAASAYSIENTNAELTGDFVLSPAKLEIDIDPGSTATRTISITNRVNKDVNFSVSVEDFEGSEDPNQAVVLLGDKTGPYSLKDFIKPEISTFSLKPGERITIPIAISIPQNAEPGGLYGSVLVQNVPDQTGNGAQTVSRLGALLFVRVAGAADEAGSLKNFQIEGGKKVFTHGPFPFEFIYQNTGNVHLIPYGVITIYNILGNPVKTIDVDPYFALPDAIRYRKIVWDKGVLLGRYKAVLQLNRGYGDNGGIVDTKEVVFWVLPWKWILGGIFALFVIILLIYFMTTRLEVSFKKKK